MKLRLPLRVRMKQTQAKICWVLFVLNVKFVSEVLTVNLIFKGAAEFDDGAIFLKPRIGTGRGRGKVSPHFTQPMIRDRGPPRGGLPPQFERKVMTFLLLFFKFDLQNES